MRVKVPKEWKALPNSQKARLEEYCKEVAYEAARRQEEHDCRVILDIYMKMTCLVLHQAFGFGEKRLRMYIGNHKRLFARQVKLVAKGEQLEYLDREMAKIFRKDGFPQEFIDDMLGEVKTPEAKAEPSKAPVSAVPLPPPRKFNGYLIDLDGGGKR